MPPQGANIPALPILIDVGINRIDDDSDKGYSIVGDIDYDGVFDKAGAITPVPGGVGVMTVTMLLFNTVNSAIQLRENK